jgi:glutathione S-transferase
VELHLFSAAANWVRHGHPALVALENPQFPDFALAQAGKLRETAQWLDQVLAGQPYIAGERFTIADITAFCALEFARGLMKYRPGAEGLSSCRPTATASPNAQRAGEVSFQKTPAPEVRCRRSRLPGPSNPFYLSCSSRKV